MRESPQTEYTYEELIHYLGVAEAALKNFEARYPDLSIEYIHPEMIVNTVFSEYLYKASNELKEAISYLEPWEQDTVPIGSRVVSTKVTRLKRIENNFAKEVERIERDLDKLYHMSVYSLTSIAMQMSHLTAKFTTERIDKHEWHKEWVEKQRQHLINYHIRQCAKFQDSKDLELQYVGNTAELPRESGMYFLLYEGEIIYIGHSGNLYNRLNNHDVVREYYCKNDDSGYNVDCVFALLPIDAARSVEKKLIVVAHPDKNRQGKTL